MKSGKFTLGTKTCLKCLRSGKGEALCRTSGQRHWQQLRRHAAAPDGQLHLWWCVVNGVCVVGSQRSSSSSATTRRPSRSQRLSTTPCSQRRACTTTQEVRAFLPLCVQQHGPEHHSPVTCPQMRPCNWVLSGSACCSVCCPMWRLLLRCWSAGVYEPVTPAPISTTQALADGWVGQQWEGLLSATC